MKLYYSPGVCSLSPHIALREAGADFTLARVDLATKKLEDGSSYAALNPKGYVPALQLDDGSFLTEGPAIVQYIADQYPDAGLAPKAGTLQRARLQEWLNFIATEVHKSFTPLFRGATGEWRDAALNTIRTRFDQLDEHLRTHDYLLDDRFSVADGYLFVILGWTKPMKIDLAPWPALQAFVARIGSRPKVQEAMRAEGLLK